MNLYAIAIAYDPAPIPLQFVLADGEQEALAQAAVIADAMVDGCYAPPAIVYLVASDVAEIGAVEPREPAAVAAHRPDGRPAALAARWRLWGPPSGPG